MSGSLTVKQQEFLWGVQALLIFHVGNVSKTDDVNLGPATNIEFPVYSLRASRIIPDKMSSEHAIHSFFLWYLEKFVFNNRVKTPEWLASLHLDFDFLDQNP